MQNIIRPNFNRRNFGIPKALLAFPKIEQEILLDLLSKKIIDEQQLNVLETEYRKKVHDLPSILVGFGFVKHHIIQEILKDKYQVEQITLDEYVPDINLIGIVSKNTLLMNKFTPFDLRNDVIYVATSNPRESRTIDAIKIAFAQKYKVKLFYAPAEDITHFISSSYIIAENRLDNAVKKLREDLFLQESNSYTSSKIEDNSIVSFVTALLEDATLRGASDIHIEPQAEFIRIRYRIDGKLSNVIHTHKKFWNPIVVRIKVISNMNIAETRKPQDGRIESTISGRSIDFRLSCQPGIYGEKFVIRILDKSKSLMSLTQLGFSDFNYKKMQQTIERPAGITIVTGPTGSGKTTTLYSILSYLNNVDTNIMTLEDPVEYTVPLVFQTQVREGTSFDFAGGVRSSMRQDPDILLIGEIRDHGTAEAAIRASLTGHKVLTTLHTVDAATTIQRLVDIGIDRYMIAGNLDSVVAQKLVRKLCQNCKVPHTEFSETEKQILEKYKSLQEEGKKYTIYKANGCEDCRNTGYRGRTTVAEILHVTPAIDGAILQGATKHALIRIAEGEGFRTIQKDAMYKALEGLVSLDEIRTTVAMI